MINSRRTVLFMLLSCYLAEITGEDRIKTLALYAARCVATWMLDSSTSLAVDCLIHVANNNKQNAVLSCHLTGMVIEAFTVLAGVTKDDTWRNKAIEVADAAMKYTGWHGADGVLNVGSGGDQAEYSDIKAWRGVAY
ncbi:hypothetical protein FRC02_012400 [Tulasnella sp. 418]|nr:hypothetical protein FRC02_012400 [Tulasnella sp. 418]